ncbi:MAG: alkaline phosphatase, partial [Undibacterium sp.]|nr:alkaline phosphatase [Undibacterium sp.]
MKRTLIAAALALTFANVANAAGEAKNIIFFLGDGMGPSTVTASRIYKYGEDGSLTMDKFERTARIKTFSNDAQTTDSAPSMAAYMTGVKMNNEVISMSADTVATNPSKDVNGNLGVNNCAATGNGVAVPTILELAKAKGKAV